jgi:hypothetical protein
MKVNTFHRDRYEQLTGTYDARMLEPEVAPQSAPPQRTATQAETMIDTRHAWPTRPKSPASLMRGSHQPSTASHTSGRRCATGCSPLLKRSATDAGRRPDAGDPPVRTIGAITAHMNYFGPTNIMLGARIRFLRNGIQPIARGAREISATPFRTAVAQFLDQAVEAVVMIENDTAGPRPGPRNDHRKGHA